MAVEAYIPTLSIVTITAAIDAINPCAIGVLILMLSVLLAGKKSNREIFLLGSTYILSVLLVYFVAGLGLLYFLSSIPLWVTEYLAILVAVIIVGAALIEIKDYYWYGQGFSLMISKKYIDRIHKLSKKTTYGGIALLGAFVSAVELPCTGAPYLAIVTLLSQYFDFSAFMLLVWYNIVFVSPLIFILLLVLSGKKLSSIKNWKQNNKKYMRLLVGLLLLFMAWLLILIANGTVNFG